MSKLKTLKRFITSSKDRHRYMYLLPYALGSRRIFPCCARSIAKKNSKHLDRLHQPYLKINTYEKSNQMVHPDAIIWNDELWLVLTPYPYTVDTYENPCVYHGPSIFALKPIDSNPLSLPTKRAKKNHISDPWLTIINNNLYVFFRDTVCIKGKIIQKLFYHFTSDGVNWSKKCLFVESNEHDFVSPATINSCDILYHYFIKLDGNSGGDIWRMETDKYLNIRSTKKCTCYNLPPDMNIWHIGLSTSNSFSKDLTDKIFGLFTLRGKIETEEYRLYWASSDDKGLTWFLEEEVIIPSSMKASVNHVYKCCILPITGDILLSYFDNFYRWYFSVIPGFFDREKVLVKEKPVIIDSFRLFSRVFGSSMSYDDFLNKHLNNPHLIPNFYITINENNRIIGTNCFDGALLKTSIGEFNIAQSCDTAVDVDSRGRGIFTKMINSYTSQAKNTDVDMLFGFPNFNSIHGFMKMGWSLKASFPSLVKITKPFSVVLSKIVGHFRQRQIIECRPSRRLLSIGIDDVGISNLCPFNEQDFDVINGTNKAHIERSIDYYRWRLDSQKNKRFFYFVFKKQGILIAFFVYWVNKKGRLFIVDWFFNQSFISIFEQVLKFFFKKISTICNVIVFECINSVSYEYDAIVKMGFFDGHKKPYCFYTKKLLALNLRKIGELDSIQEKDWFINSIDIDTIFD